MALRKDGVEIPVEIALSSIETDEGVLVMAVIVDITRRKQAEQERLKLEQKMLQAQKLESLGVLAGGIAHDFNNLLTGILGNADLAMIEMSPVSPARSSIEDIQHSSIRAADLCRQMLAYSGKGKFVVKPLSLNEVITETTHLLQLSISKAITMNYNLHRELPAIEADQTQMRQVIMNLVTNASEAIGDKNGMITISTGAMECDRRYLSETFSDHELPEGLYVYVEVADTGNGIKREDLKKIFAPFYTTKLTGRGLGLAALPGIIRGHKGAIKVYSEVGRGTSFKIIFPSSDKPALEAIRDAHPEKEMKGFGKIVIIDDEESVRTVIRRALEKVGFLVLTAQDGREGLQLLQAHADARLVFLDLTMPHMSGEEVLRRLRRIRSELPIILTSGYNEQELSSRFAAKGLAEFMQKPVRLKVLYEKVQNVLSKKNGGS
jgi:signal transduction histidine kinase/ActR/RegA family two-component response regulator